MVQRKVPCKLGMQADHIKANNQMVNPKPSLTSQNNDHIKNNRGADLKKKMMKKKSGKTKNSEYESFRKHVPQPGKPPPFLHSTPKKQQQEQNQQSSLSIKGAVSTPNYMKSTSSSVARKEQSQVSSRSPQTYSPGSKSSSTKNLKLGSPVNKPTRSIARTSSLKRVRTLTKTPSFKPARVSAKKCPCPPIDLCENVQVERATCSSTMKEAKFPPYLELSPGGTESDGTSIMKVCPYTYCSLNGHHHPPLPPLKCFLSARRRTLKTQRNFKLGCLSPRRANSRGSILHEDVTKQKQNTAGVAPLTNDDDGEFFVEIYSKESREEMADATADSVHVPSDEVSEMAAKHYSGKHLGDDTEENLDQKREAISAEVNIPGFCPGENLNEEIDMPPINQGGEDFDSSNMYSELDPEDTTEELNSEASDMDWDAEKYYAYSTDEKGSIPNDTEPNTVAEYSDFSEEFTEKSSNPVCSNPDLLSDNIPEESLDKESVISETCYSYDDSQSTCSQSEFDIDGYVDVSNLQIPPQSFVGGNEDTEEPGNEPSNSYVADGEIETMDYQAAAMTDDEISSYCEECITIQDDEAIALVGYQELNFCRSSEVQEETSKDDGGSQTNSDENIVVEKEDVETETDRCEEGNENDHGINDKQLVVEVDAKGNTNEDLTSQQAKDGPGDASVTETDPTGEACAEKMNQIKNAPTFNNKKTRAEYDLSEELSESSRNLRGIGRRIDIDEPGEREFNPRPPNFLPMEPDPEAEKVDLRHQMMDDRKNAEDWMLDFALRRAVDKLAPARKRKVALLVEAFETVMPTSKWEHHLRRSTAQFAHPRPIQACS